MNHPSLCFRLHHPLPSCPVLPSCLSFAGTVAIGSRSALDDLMFPNKVTFAGTRGQNKFDIIFLEPLFSPLWTGYHQKEHFENLESWGAWWGGDHMTEPRFLTTARAPQECCVLWRGQGEDECGGADGPDEAASERLHEGKAEEPAAPSQPCP